jgi:NAD(P)-dependent dehydrogenase (short-subunit alcohol dehydrogenase family)
LAAPIALTQGLTPALQPGGSVVFFGSATILKGLPRYSVYIASKAGIVGFSRSIAAELGARAITVNTVSPGLTDTAMNDNVPAAQIEFNIAGRAIKRTALPNDIVGAVRFLLSASSRFITGQMLVVDGGSTRH